ncbi:hypothetical protein [Pseudooceanicola atlanticus]|jgi:hypothetical protein|uniref:Ketol-acid reductoisomerase n=1 Tax=Pseudooceanicola atlanticus TaxID=1461694 RepID=A0A0A0EFS8_9RHOB|nr:hypothetical protein [Pseudooceanicola atlanticus]KGM48062.1 ketol-acid reductoisomerase [Pseudooceanicola atlanticus]
MCLTTEALLLFLNLLPQDIVVMGEDRIVVKAETRDAIWISNGEKWCTDAPKIDAAYRLKPGVDI